MIVNEICQFLTKFIFAALCHNAFGYSFKIDEVGHARKQSPQGLLEFSFMDAIFRKAR